MKLFVANEFRSVTNGYVYSLQFVRSRNNHVFFPLAIRNENLRIDANRCAALRVLPKPYEAFRKGISASGRYLVTGRYILMGKTWLGPFVV